jgi:hypothetical protein
VAHNSKQIPLAVEHIRPGLKLGEDFDLADRGDGNGPFMSAWNRDDLAAPTIAEIEEFGTDALLKDRSRFLSRELIADDCTNIARATSSSPASGLSWAVLLAEGDALISFPAEWFKQGWAGMSQVLGAERASAIAHAV